MIAAFVSSLKDERQETTATSTAASTASTGPSLLQKPSYFSDSFRKHFVPHSEVNGDGVDEESLPSFTRKKLNIFQRYAMSMARKPWVHLSTAFVIAVVLSYLGLKFGNFKVVIDNSGWRSRGTLIANRATQEMIVAMHKEELFHDETGEVWEELMTKVQPNWQPKKSTDEEYEDEGTEIVDDETLASVCSGQWYGSMDMVMKSENNLVAVWQMGDAESMDTEQSMLDRDALYDLCLAEEKTMAMLQNDDSCYKCPTEDSEGHSSTEKCLEPYSLVLLARLYLSGNDMSQLSTLSESIRCDSLRSLWSPSIQQRFTMALKTCVNWSVRMASGNGDKNITIQDTTILVSNPCPFPLAFLPTVVDELFPAADPPIVRYSSSYFATKKSMSDVKIMYNSNENEGFGQSDGGALSGVYDTTDQSFYDLYSEEVAGSDMAMALGSAVVTVLAMMVHTKSPFLTFCGLFQIVLSFPLAYFIYHFAGNIDFFPFLNFIGVFVVFALGADYVFVAVDTWKNARLELPEATTEQVAAVALPDAAYSLLLTTTTTTVAFFATAICPVGPILCFAIFCGLLITFDYIMNVLLVFPALCIYDKWLLSGSRNCCITLDWTCRKKEKQASQDTKSRRSSIATTPANDSFESAFDTEGPIEDSAATNASEEANAIEESVEAFPRDGDEEDCDSSTSATSIKEVDHKSFIHRIFDSYYTFLHKLRWLVLAIIIAVFITCTVFASKLSLPTSSEVSLLRDDNQYQMHWLWGQNLLSSRLVKEKGTEAVILWGVSPADTGDHKNPDSWTTLVLDGDFEPKSEESQQYLLGFCDSLFAEFGKVEEDYECPMNAFDKWLKEQSSVAAPTDAYTQSCNGASAVPVPSDIFDPCMIAWSTHTESTDVLETGGEIKIMEVRAKSGVAYDAPFNELKDKWTSYETWLDDERKNAPSGVNQMFHSDFAFWWYGTNKDMLNTAYGAAGIALICAAVVMFVSSRSFVLTILSVASIAYVLVASTACLVGLGWELGFLESILFAILIGISCDFVIHFSHSYAMHSGSVSRHHRSHFSLTHMGPSILAAAFTTFAAAVLMVFTEIVFFRKFAVMLFMTIVHAIIGSFVVFIVLCDCFGPAEPTKGYDTIKATIKNSYQIFCWVCKNY